MQTSTANAVGGQKLAWGTRPYLNRYYEMMAPNAAPKMTATARSSMLPFIANSLNSFNMVPPPLVVEGAVVLFAVSHDRTSLADYPSSP